MTSKFNWAAMPKVCLHEHIDGGLRPATLLELSRLKGIELPHQEPAAIAQWMADNANSGSLVRYLEGFSYTVDGMATLEACERVAFELAQDSIADGCVLAEFRMAPQLFEPFGLSNEAVIEAFIAGMQKSGLASGLIICGMRHHAPEVTAVAAQLAAKYAGKGVVAFDLAGPEFGFPAKDHEKAINIARDAGLGITLHAGEADAGHQVIEAARLGAARIGHGVNVVRQEADGSPRWTDQAKALGLHFEVCPSSNVHTGAATSIAAHPIRAMLDAGLSLSCSTDNRLMSDTTLCKELELIHQQANVSLQEIIAMQYAGIEASFLPEDVKAAAKAKVQAWEKAQA